MKDCLFCKIINKEIKSDIIYENENVVVFKDINPQAPVHLLLVPKQHISSIVQIDKLACDQICELVKSISKIAKELGLDSSGFRVVTNTGTSAGQSVDHLHFHIMGKRDFKWPPG
ncbi:MAG: histidine triad nucleotide-binding protein [Actinobacteria bacterium]|nr:histidine triad nucleotide-binding protein [Actinomycetota bacterium]